MTNPDSGGGFRGPRPLGRLVPAIAGKALGKRGLAFGALVKDWDTILGPDLARLAVPDRLAFPPGRRDGAVLHIRTGGGAALELQHCEPQVVERINSYFGYAAVARLRLIHAPTGRHRRTAPPPPATAAEQQAIDNLTAGIDSDPLRQALKGLALAMKGRAPTD